MLFSNRKTGKNLMPVDSYGDEDDNDMPGLTDPDEPADEGTTTYSAFNTGKNGSVNLKLFSPKSHKEATDIANELMNRCIVVLDISTLPTDSAMRLIDFLSGVVHVMNGKMDKMNNGTFIVAPNGVDIDQLMAGENKKN